MIQDREYAIPVLRQVSQCWGQQEKATDCEIVSPGRIGRLLLWLLKRWGCDIVRTPLVTSEAWRTINTATVRESIRLSEYQMEEIWHQRATKIVMGRDKMIQLTREVEDLQFMAMQVPMELGRNGLTRVFGLEVILVPWMEGMVLLP